MKCFKTILLIIPAGKLIFFSDMEGYSPICIFCDLSDFYVSLFSRYFFWTSFELWIPFDDTLWFWDAFNKYIYISNSNIETCAVYLNFCYTTYRYICITFLLLLFVQVLFITVKNNMVRKYITDVSKHGVS